jgi:hypothetical protein
MGDRELDSYGCGVVGMKKFCEFPLLQNESRQGKLRKSYNYEFCTCFRTRLQMMNSLTWCGFYLGVSYVQVPYSFMIHA